MDNDTISRQAAIDAVEFGLTYAKAINKETGVVKNLFEESNKELMKAVERIKQLPSAQPRKKKEWIDRGKDMTLRWECPVCGRRDRHIYNFCPDCGEDLRWRTMRLIDADALIEDCKKYRDTLVPERDAREFARIGWLIGILNEQPTIEPQKWIPCSERLPESFGNYLVSYRTDNDEPDIGVFDPKRIDADTGAWTACDANGWYWVASKGLEVTAWQPLPEPYGGDT